MIEPRIPPVDVIVVAILNIIAWVVFVLVAVATVYVWLA